MSAIAFSSALQVVFENVRWNLCNDLPVSNNLNIQHTVGIRF